MSEVQLKALRKSASDKLRSLKKKPIEKEEYLPNEDSASIDAARQSHAINVFHQEFNVDPTTECLKR